jgi:hypothetical protein
MLIFLPPTPFPYMAISWRLVIRDKKKVGGGITSTTLLRGFRLWGQWHLLFGIRRKLVVLVCLGSQQLLGSPEEEIVNVWWPCPWKFGCPWRKPCRFGWPVIEGEIFWDLKEASRLSLLGEPVAVWKSWGRNRRSLVAVSLGVWVSVKETLSGWLASYWGRNCYWDSSGSYADARGYNR